MKKVIAAGLVAASIVSAAPAHADGGDQAYLRYLNDNGVGYTSAISAIMLGHTICAVVDNNPQHSTLLAIINIVETNETLSAYQAEAVLRGAIGAYCDRYTYLLNRADRTMLR